MNWTHIDYLYVAIIVEPVAAHSGSINSGMIYTNIGCLPITLRYEPKVSSLPDIANYWSLTKRIRTYTYGSWVRYANI